MTPIYLRDLSPEMQREFMNGLSQAEKRRVDMAIREDFDIVVGQYYPAGKFKIEK